MSYEPVSFQRNPRRQSPWGSLLLMILIASTVAWLVSSWLMRPGALHDANSVPRVVTARGDLAEDEKSTIALFRQASPCVVHITTLGQDRYGLSDEAVPLGTGSGFIWDDQGHVVTNFHVIRGANAAQVTLNDNSTHSARLVGVAPDYDLAVLKIDVPFKAPPSIPIGSSHDLAVGQKTFAIGNPFGLDQTLTTGIISALGRQITSTTNQRIENVIQTDAAINPGNSGGPLLDSAGRLIGVNTQIVSSSGSSAGIGFAIPVDTVNLIVPELIRSGRLVVPTISGAKFTNDARARQLGLRRGVLVWEVVPGSDADRAGLKSARRTATQIVGDVITEIDGKEVADLADLVRQLKSHKVGDSVKLTVVRNREERLVTVVLQGN